MSKILNKIFGLSPFRVSLYVTLLVMALFGYTVIEEDNYLNLLDKKWVDFIQKSRTDAVYSDQIVIAAIDTKSIDQYGRWPWPREVIAKAVESLNEHYQVSTIGFDIVFSEADQTPLALARRYVEEFSKRELHQSETGKAFLDYMQQTATQNDGDLYFGEALSKYDNVVLGYIFVNETDIPHLSQETIEAAQKRLRPQAISIIRGKLQQAILPEGYFPEMTIEKISGPKPTMGFFNTKIDPEDGVVRRVQVVLRSNGRYFSSLALQMFANYVDQKIEVSGDSLGLTEIKLGKRVLYPFPDGTFLVNFKGPVKTFVHHSIADIIDKTIPVEALQGKMVLMGITEFGVLDLRVTPVSEAYPGVEVHANLLDNLLSDSYFRDDFSNDIYTFLLILLFGVLLGFIIPRIKLGYSIGLVVLLLVGYTFAHRFAVTTLLTWPSFIFVSLQIVFCSIAVTQYMFFVADRDKRFIRSAFQQYLSPAVINQLMDDPDMLQLGGEERVMTALFSDVKGFSTISEQLTPPELVQLLNEYLTEMSNIILKYEGTVDKFEGDAIIAFFGAPVNYPDHATRAALACLEMQSRLAEMRLEWRKQNRQELFHRIGINTGQMVVGNMGSSTRFDYTMMGNSVNLAARLEGANKIYQNELLMSEMSYKSCQDSIEARELDQIQVVGIKEPIKIYEILGRKGELDNHRRKTYEIFSRGLEAYRQQNWDKAERYFKEVQKNIPDDGPTATFISRCQEYRKSPPPPDWNGVYVATSK